jgi:hypothetical protein
MKKVFILLSLTVSFLFVSTAYAQTPITFAKGKMQKSMVITVKAGGENKYVIAVNKGQIVNVDADGDIGVSKKESFPVVWINMNYKDVDQTQDGEAYYSLYAGRTGKYVITVGNSDKKRARTFKLIVSVSNNKEDFRGGVIE